MLPLFRDLGYPELAPITDAAPRPFWSVVIPVHNRTTWLKQCVESVVSQLKEDYELLIVDTSTTPQVLTPISQSNYKTIWLANLGPMDNWNRAIGLARGKWIHLLNDDDYVLPGFYARLRGGIEGREVGAASTGYENDNNGVMEFRNRASFSTGVLDSKQWLPIIGRSMPLNTPAVVIARDTYEKIGLYRPDILMCADWELYRRAACTVSWWSDMGYLARWRQHADQGNRQIDWPTKYDSLLQTIELGRKYYPPSLAEEVALTARKYWFHCGCEEAVFWANEGEFQKAHKLLLQVRRLLK